MENQCVFEYPQINMKLTGDKLRCVCREHHVSVRDIQKALHISSNQAIYDWFNGKTMPSLNNFYALSKLLKVPMEELLICEKMENLVSVVDVMHINGYCRRLLEYRKRIIRLAA